MVQDLNAEELQKMHRRLAQLARRTIDLTVDMRGPRASFTSDPVSSIHSRSSVDSLVFDLLSAAAQERRGSEGTPAAAGAAPSKPLSRHTSRADLSAAVVAFKRTPSLRDMMVAASDDLAAASERRVVKDLGF